MHKNAEVIQAATTPSAGVAAECPFAIYYQRETRWASVALFVFVAGNYALAPLYREWFLGSPANPPAAIWLVEYGVILLSSAAAAWVRWQRPESALADPVTIAAVAAVSASIIAVRYIWVQAGVPFFNELIGYFLIAAMVMTGIEFRRLCYVAVPALLADSIVSYLLYGWGPHANFELLSNLTAGSIAVFAGWSFEKYMRRVWAKTGTLERLARQDTLTELLNRRGFLEQAQHMLNQAARDKNAIAVALVDLDHFKPFNDHYGHPAGDDALRAVARVLAEHARRPLDLVARLGGEEFVILWFDMNAERLQQHSQALVDAVRALGIPHAPALSGGRLTISLGAVAVVVAGMPQHAPHVGLLIEQADQLMYQAKQQGRDRAVIQTL
ncbi:MAG: GGDEF domain-containing protein [Burkholderiales bacterium]